MPGRRGSSAAAHSSQTLASSVTSRTFRSQDSHPHLASQSPQPSVTFSGHANPQQKVVQTLINRLKNKLPCVSGISLDRLEADPSIQQVIETLVELSADCLDYIAWSLSDVLDKLQTQMNHVEPTRMPDLLQSQLMILKILSITMASRWCDPRQRSDPASREASVAPDSPIPPPYLPHHPPGSDHHSSPSLWSEPPPIDSNIAKYILHVLVTFLTPSSYLPTSSSDFSTVEMVFWEYQQLDLYKSSVYLESRRDASTSADNRIPSATGRTSPTPILRNRHSATSMQSSLPSMSSSYVPSAFVSTAYESTHMSLVNDMHILNKLVVKFAGRIIHHLSAANWKVVFSKVRSRIHQLADNERKEPPPDTPDLFIMAHCALDRVKLIQVLNELSSLLVNLRHNHLLQVMQPLRLAIWKWIETFPHEFNDVMHGRSRLEGAPERLFDQLYAVVQPGRERDIWPTLMALNCIAPERISADFGLAGTGGDIQGRSKPYGRKDVKFGEDILKHCNTATKLTETAIQCALDLCRAAAKVKVEDDAEVTICEIAGDVAHEIKVGLWSNEKKKPFWESEESIDVAMFSEVLVAVYRFLDPEEGMALFCLCLDPERSEAVKTCAVRACLILALEADQFPWTRSTDALHGQIGLRVTSIFASMVSSRNEMDRFGTIKKPQPRPRSRPSGATSQLSDRDTLLLFTLALWRADPSLYLSGLAGRDIRLAINSLSRMFASPTEVTVKLSTAYTLRIAVEVIASLNPGDQLYDIGVEWLQHAVPASMAAIASTLIYARTDTEQQRLWTNVLQHFLKIYTTKREAQHMKDFQLDAKRVPAFAMSEIAFMISLTSSDTAVCQAAAQGLRALAQAQRVPGAPVNPGVSEEDRSKRNPVFEQLGDPKVAVVGRVGYQKRIRRLMRLIAYPCASHVAVWQECYWRWRSLSETIIESMAEYGAEDAQAYRAAMTLDLQDKHNQWKNLTLFLAAFGGASLIDDGTRPSLTDSIPPEYMPDDLRVLQNPTNLVVTFLTDLTNLLVAEYVDVREIARDALGTELSPRLFPKLLSHLTTVVATITQGAGSEFADTYVLFLDQFIALLKLLVENLNFIIDDIDGNATLAALAVFIDRFEFPGATRIKIKFCQLCEVVYTRFKAIALNQAVRKETLSRNTVVDYIMEWVRDPSLSSDKESVSLQSELNITCLRTLSMLLERMKLQPLDGSSGDDTGHLVSRLFMKYSTALLKMLELNQLDVLTSDSASDVPTLQHRIRVSHKEGEARDFVITALAHLVTANSEPGFKHILPLAYDPDPRKKMIHAYVFARVLGEGTKFEPPEQATAQSPHARLKELVKAPDLVVALAVCETCPPSEMDVTISALLNVFDTRASLMRLIKLLIDREIATTETEASLFRGNSICTRFLSAFARIHGYNYLRNLILPLVKIMTSTPGQGYELDPSKAGAQDVAQNQQHVEVVATSFLNILFSSIPTLPSMFREICAHIAQSVVDVWPEAKFAALGAFIFLRFISPAVVAPETVDIEIPSEDAIAMRRGLMVITKIIQNLANNIFFGKEQHMMCLNKFLEANIVNVTKYLSELNKYSESPSENDNDDEWLGGVPDETDALVLHRYFEKHADKIGKELLSHSKAAAEADNMSVPGKKAWDQLCALLVDLGQSPELPRYTALSAAQHPAYKDIMARFAHRSTSEVAESLVEGPTQPDEPILLIFHFAQAAEGVETDLIMYHFFKTLTAPGNEKRPFQVVIDCTMFTDASEVPVQWWKGLAEQMPLEMQQRWLTTYILNPNSLAQKYLRRIFNLCSTGSPFPSETRACSSVSELATFVSASSLQPLRYAAAFESEPKEIYIDVLKRYHAYLPITLEVGTTHVRMTSAKAQPIAAALSCRTVDIVLLADISDVYNVSTGQEPNEFVIRRSRQGITLYFSSILRDSIVKNIRATKALLKEHQPPMSERFSRFSNGPATLLHVGMLHMETDNEELRSASFALLGSVCSYVGLTDCPVVAATTGFVPKDAASFVVELSSSLARLAPHMTLDFISEVAAGLSGLEFSAIAQKTNCPRYLSPWIQNLQVYTNPVHPLYERSGARLRDCIRVLAEMVVTEHELTTLMQTHIWAEVSKLDSATVNVVLDEIVRMTVDGTLGSRRWESLARIVSTLSSVNIRGRLLSRLRKSLGKASPKAYRSLEHTPHWNELATLIRLVCISGPVPGNNGLYLPELFHVVVLLAGTGLTLVRKSVYGIVINFLQTLYAEHPDTALSSEVIVILGQMEETKTLRLFGLERPKSTSEYADYDPKPDKVAIDGYGDLTKLLLRILEVASGSQGLLNVWRARWMSLVASTAFQISPAIQARAFIVLGELATSDVDDDFLYQMLVAFKTSLSQSTETDTTAIVSMLRCMCQIVPALSDGARYLCPLFWLAVALIQSSHITFYVEATQLLERTLIAMEAKGMLVGADINDLLLGGRSSLQDIAIQLDSLLGISFTSDFSFSLAAVIFKGIRHTGLRESAESVLRTLLRITVQGKEGDVVPRNALGYFVALLPLSNSADSYQQLLRDAGVPDSMEEDFIDGAADVDSMVPTVPLEWLGLDISDTPLLVASFIGSILSSAQGDDSETQMLCSLLADMVAFYPDTIALTYELYQDRIKDSFANSSNPAIIRAACIIFRVALQDAGVRTGSSLRGSASTLNTVDETASNTPGRLHLSALEDLNLHGLTSSFQFLPPNRGLATKMINWIPELVSRMID